MKHGLMHTRVILLDATETGDDVVSGTVKLFYDLYNDTAWLEVIISTRDVLCSQGPCLSRHHRRPVEYKSNNSIIMDQCSPWISCQNWR
jgi:hypothetical protein